MWDNILDLAKSAASFLQSGVAPPDCPPALQQQMACINHLASKKFFLAFSGFIILGIFFAASVMILFVAAAFPQIIAAYVVLFSKVIEIFGLVMSVYIGAQGLVDLRYNSSSNASIQGQVLTEDITKTIRGNQKDDDYNLNIDEYQH